MLDLALLNQVLYGTSNVFDWHVGINAVLIEQVDYIGFEALERGLGDLLDVLRTAVQAAPTRSAIGIRFEPEFGGDHHLVTKWSQRFAHEFFVGERTVNFGGVEERYAAFDGRPNQRDHLLLVRSRTITEAHSHAAEAECRNFQIAFSKFALLHCFSLSNRFSHSEIRIKRRGSGIPILPIYCLFLLLWEKSLVHPRAGSYPKARDKEATNSEKHQQKRHSAARSSARIASRAGSQDCLVHWARRETDNRHSRACCCAGGPPLRHRPQRPTSRAWPWSRRGGSEQTSAEPLSSSMSRDSC